MKLSITQASLSVVLSFAALFVGTQVNNSGSPAIQNSNTTSVICPPSVAGQIQPKL
jgi:hypothetical protein